MEKIKKYFTREHLLYEILVDIMVVCTAFKELHELHELIVSSIKAVLRYSCFSRPHMT